jgi:hypothetical protein
LEKDEDPVSVDSDFTPIGSIRKLSLPDQTRVVNFTALNIGVTRIIAAEQIGSAMERNVVEAAVPKNMKLRRTTRYAAPPELNSFCRRATTSSP